MMSTLCGQLARPQPVITPLPTAPTSHAAPLPGRQVRYVTPDNQPHPMHNQEPQHPATEPLRPLVPPSQETHRRLPNSVHAPLPPRKPTPTRPRSFERAATWGGALQGNRGYDHHGQHHQRRSSFGTPWSGSGRGRDGDKGRTRPASPPATHPSLRLRLSGRPAQSVQPTEDPIPTSALFTVEDGPTVFLASTPQRCD
ncbi:hypothetical protein BDN67DRAFT_719766 [Paxillus ammoniavirescens]|nr:hypothetical protein BDN67DRAFT_719766 [Paxillus ammoniavirescens]